MCHLGKGREGEILLERYLHNYTLLKASSSFELPSLSLSHVTTVANGNPGVYIPWYMVYTIMWHYCEINVTFLWESVQLYSVSVCVCVYVITYIVRYIVRWLYIIITTYCKYSLHHRHRAFATTLCCGNHSDHTLDISLLWSTWESVHTFVHYLLCSHVIYTDLLDKVIA